MAITEKQRRAITEKVIVGHLKEIKKCADICMKRMEILSDFCKNEKDPPN
jgi:hypothetical protein